MDTIFLALCFVLAVDYRIECFVGDVLKGLRTTDVTCVGIDEQKRFDFGYSCHNPSYRNVLAKLGTADFADRQRNLRVQGFKVQVASSQLD